MPQGLQCFDANGNEVFNSNSSTLRHVETFSISVGAGARSVGRQSISENSVLTGWIYDSTRSTRVVPVTAYQGGAAFTVIFAGTLNIAVFAVG